MTKIALFGTSADPPTSGHQNILSWLAQHYDLVVVWASDNPFKEHQTSLKHRTEMLRLAIAEIAQPNKILLQAELSDRKTLITVKKARKIWGEEAEFTLVIGSDLVKQIVTWYRIEELFTQVQLLIVPRPGYSITKTDLEAISKKGGKYAIATLNVPQVSSTDYRREGDQQVITPAVQNYITQKHLYNTVTNY
ncbi:nicotinate-nucleotide adenylyltransferase [Stanieria cyanosphaera PCC 7437]|uniref:Probable nicotinate-nucleotide adenylyltransferase n=1 Tax=Stanieria cyanosphaera (strain ATCC 29371 / PCC 7437) TaxID=111780 RepID=K9Y0R8_STAC7|nr:nicotinate-nucleotide adenylyltransferase [Stanieria cyanosphaera]AFZ37532.1 nicotinate-nucleotide adenylyltransferase [Stanieria cyanosphaera PCC 7437]